MMMEVGVHDGFWSAVQICFPFQLDSVTVCSPHANNPGVFVTSQPEALTRKSTKCGHVSAWRGRRKKFPTSFSFFGWPPALLDGRLVS
uniref:Uncharacterized protein n=1 Tax=Daphnia galeata TaxID=27404 RepID=A0A8J2WMJ6_9CRUS|nr:unnamed protein product [Daphnia galeata]